MSKSPTVRAASRDREPYHTYPHYMINVTFAKQIGEYAKYVLDHNLHGIFHVGTTDTVSSFSFGQMVCEALKIKLPQFVAETVSEELFFAILPARKEIPNDLQMTVSDVLSAMNHPAASSGVSYPGFFFQNAASGGELDP